MGDIMEMEIADIIAMCVAAFMLGFSSGFGFFCLCVQDIKKRNAKLENSKKR
jgi:hypothetical protein